MHERGSNMYTEQQKQASRFFQHWKTARAELLIIFILAVVNILAIPLMDTFFVLAPYISSFVLLTSWGMYMESYAVVLYIVGAIISLFVVAAYLVCYILSKKHRGAMLAGAIMYGIDTVWVIFDTVSMFAAGETAIGIDYLLMILWHGLGMFMFISALIKCRTAPVDPALIQKAEAEESAAATDAGILSVNEDGTFAETVTDWGTRQLTVVRKKNFVGCAIKFNFSVNGKDGFSLANGKSETLTVTAGPCRLEARTGNGIAGSVDIPAGTENVTFEVSMKMGMWANEFVFTRK